MFLEQYLTPPEVVADIVWLAFLRGEIKGKRVADLGCGTGRFCAAASFLGAYCACIEIDNDSITLAKKVFKDLGIDADFINADVEYFYSQSKFDTVIENPPFGVKRKGYDLIFLNSALDLSNDVVYSIHKSNEKSEKIIKNIARKKGFSSEVITTNFEIGYYYPWHRNEIHKFLVDIYLFKKIT
ncbi:MAG: METTL5 family protein [Acidianus infernus]|nr:METTL5 family protein [Acidianus infernus]MCY0884226.1 METTL5 family protein [Acidianus infernus]